jgi:hypothetical protein
VRIVDKERALTRTATNFTEIWLIGTDAEVQAVTGAVALTGSLIYRSAPQPMGGTDLRTRVYLRLHLHHT